MVYYSGSKAARNASSITNNTKHLGSMAGIVTCVNRPTFACIAISKRAPTAVRWSTNYELAIREMKTAGVFQKRELCSGGVGRAVLLRQAFC